MVRRLAIFAVVLASACGSGGGTAGTKQAAADPCGVAGLWAVDPVYTDSCSGVPIWAPHFEFEVTSDVAQNGGEIGGVGRFDVATCTLTSTQGLDQVCLGPGARNWPAPFRDGAARLPVWSTWANLSGTVPVCECAVMGWNVAHLPGTPAPSLYPNLLPLNPPACARHYRSCAAKTCQPGAVVLAAQWVCYDPNDPGSLSGSECLSWVGVSDWMRDVPGSVCMHCSPSCSWTSCCSGTVQGPDYPACIPLVSHSNPATAGACSVGINSVEVTNW